MILTYQQNKINIGKLETLMIIQNNNIKFINEQINTLNDNINKLKTESENFKKIMNESINTSLSNVVELLNDLMIIHEKINSNELKVEQ
jgi:archaellum component FlaC